MKIILISEIINSIFSQSMCYKMIGTSQEYSNYYIWNKNNNKSITMKKGVSNMKEAVKGWPAVR